MDFLLEQILFFLSIIIVLFLPGYSLLQTVFGSKNNKAKINKKSATLFSPIEQFTISFGLSIVSVTFLMILMGRSGISISRENTLIVIGLFIFACYLVSLKKRSSLSLQKVKILNKISNLKTLFIQNSKSDTNLKSCISGFFINLWPKTNIFPLPLRKTRKMTSTQNKQTLLIVLILFLTIFIKTSYLKNVIFPTSTDLGHHMYWSKQISETGKIPTYEKLSIPENSENFELKTEKIDDFIIGEHLIFSAINLISGISFISYFPTLVLFLVNIVSLLALFILTLKLFENYKFKRLKTIDKYFKNNIGIISLLLIGPVYALASPQAKFVSGGVVGNLLGNLLIPLALYFYFRAFRNPTSKNSRRFLVTALFTTMGLFYAHHLSSLIFLFIVFFIIIAFIFMLLFSHLIDDWRFWRWKLFKNLPTDRQDYKLEIKKYAKLVFSSQSIIALILVAFFVSLIYTPSYLSIESTETALGSPSKSTRTGLTFTQLKYAIGEPRLALGIIGLILLGFQSFETVALRKNKKASGKDNALRTMLLVGWALAVSVMSLKPQWLHINIPSGRVANYANFPFAIISSFALIWLFSFIKDVKISKMFLPKQIVAISFVLMLLTILSSGYYDNSQSLSEENNSQSAIKTFHASQYLAAYRETSPPDKAMILKDHNYIKADAWIKLFFMRDYNYPLSRGFFKRYEDPTNPREMCTFWMIESPTSEKSQKCYLDTQTKFIMINPKVDGIQFKSDQEFWKIYSGSEISIFYRK